MKDLGHLQYFLGTRLLILQKGIFYLKVKTKYCNDVTEAARLKDAKPVSTIHFHPTTEGVPLSNPTRYRAVVGMGSLVYVTITGNGISFAVLVVSQFVAHSTYVHWAAVLHILQYLQGTTNRAILMHTNCFAFMTANYDSDWVGDVNCQRLKVDYQILNFSRLFTHILKKQETRSSL